MTIRLVQITLIISLLLSGRLIFGQVPNDLEHMEDSLRILSIKSQKAENDSVKLLFNKRFHETLYRALLLAGSFDYPFDSLRTIAKLTSPDKKFRIYNWNLPQGDGTNTYFGFIQMNPRENPVRTVYDLLDRSDSIPLPETAMLDNRSWFGALYYRMILTTFKNQKFYTLLGWDGMNSQITQKIVEVLYFAPSGQPVFGSEIFRNYGNDKICRVLFQYSSSASMVLAYDDQYLLKNKKWNPSKKQFESDRVKVSMIVCDELVPMDPQFEGQFDYYIPSSDIYNGFVFEEGKWNFYKDVDVRNKFN